MDEPDYFERRVGTTLRGKWTLERLLGVGGMAAVYESVHTKLGRRDAVKILHPSIARSADARQRFEQEALAVNRLQHPGAIEVRDIEVTEDGAPFLVMELLEGESLADRLRSQGPLPAEDVFRYAEQILNVLEAAHAAGIIHRDIKPDNLFLLRDGRVKVLDFGVARLRQQNAPGTPTRTGALIGTVAYMAPEQVSGRSDLDGRADLFSVGATMFRL
ncbi:MAG: serine/threonine-protein kinase, partial [Myxococcales bacterium]|nr:serine/threonine protein kinase [Polyangiaceae bacterium]MDW8249868.1 serine/threonine-protein kinase [Myxococcales bacterium]